MSRTQALNPNPLRNSQLIKSQASQAIMSEAGNGEPPEITALLKPPDFRQLFPDLPEEVIRAMEVQWISWVNLVDWAITNWLNDGNLDVMSLAGVPHGVVLDVLKARGYLIRTALEGNRVISLVRIGRNYGILQGGLVKIPNNINEDLGQLYAYYGCTIGRQYITCPSIAKYYRFNNLTNVTYVRDTEASLDFIRIDTTSGSYAFDISYKAVSDWMLGLGITTDANAIKALLYLIASGKPVVNHYATGFILKDGKITWSPGIFGYTPKPLNKEEVVNEVGKLRKALDEVSSAFERPEIALAFMGLHIAYAFYRPYRRLLGNADTPVPIIFGIPNLNKTTIANFVVKSFMMPEDIELITEGVQVTETIPRLAGLMTESTLPVVLDDVVINDTLAEIILQIGASSGYAISIARAKRHGPGLEDKIPLMRMIIPIMNAEDEEEVYNAFLDNARRKYNRAQLMAILNRRVLLINMNRAMPSGSELRQVIMGLELPDVTAILYYLVNNYHDDVIMLMRQDYEELRGKYLNFLWFAYGLWKFLIPAITDFKHAFNDVADAIRDLAVEREESQRWIFEVQREEVRERIENEDRELLRNAFQRWVMEVASRNKIPINGIGDEILLLLRNAHRAGVDIRPFTSREVDELVNVKRNLVRIICTNPSLDINTIGVDYTLDKDICMPEPWVGDALFAELARRFGTNELKLYLRRFAFRTVDNPRGIGAPRVLLGRPATEYERGRHGYRFTLDEFLTVIYDSLENKLRGNPDELNTLSPTSPTGSALISAEKSDEGVGGVDNETGMGPSDSSSVESDVGEVGDIGDNGNGASTGEGTNVGGKDSTDCESKCRSRYPGTSPMSMLLYSECLNECRLLGNQG